MRKDTVTDHFGNGAKTAEALGISPQAVSQWGEIIPEGMAYKVQAITGGDLVVDPTLYPRRGNAAPAPSSASVDAA